MSDIIFFDAAYTLLWFTSSTYIIRGKLKNSKNNYFLANLLCYHGTLVSNDHHDDRWAPFNI
jgi:hypothetical protein